MQLIGCKKLKNGGPIDPATLGLEEQALAFVSPTSALVTGNRDFYLFMIVAFIDEIVFAF